MAHIPDHKHLTVGDLRAILDDRASIKKNGHTWGQYLSKWVTPQNLLIVVMAGFTLGGRIQQAQTELADVVRSNARLVAEIATLSKTVDAQQRVVDTQQVTIAEQRDLFATKQDLRSAAAIVDERVKQAVTRREFQEFQRTVLPALQRIERSVDK